MDAAISTSTCSSRPRCACSAIRQTRTPPARSATQPRDQVVRLALAIRDPEAGHVPRNQSPTVSVMWYAMRPPNIGSISVLLRERDWPPMVSSASMCISRPPASASSVIRPVRPTGQGDEPIGPAELEEQLLVVQIRLNAGRRRLVLPELEVQEIRQAVHSRQLASKWPVKPRLKLSATSEEVDRGGPAGAHGEVDLGARGPEIRAERELPAAGGRVRAAAPAWARSTDPARAPRRPPGRPAYPAVCRRAAPADAGRGRPPRFIRAARRGEPRQDYGYQPQPGPAPLSLPESFAWSHRSITFLLALGVSAASAVAAHHDPPAPICAVWIAWFSAFP